MCAAGGSGAERAGAARAASIRDTPHPLPAMSVVRRRIDGMRTLEICERCDGTGADPFQYDEEITVCVECSGDGCHVTYLVELQQTA